MPPTFPRNPPTHDMTSRNVQLPPIPSSRLTPESHHRNTGAGCKAPHVGQVSPQTPLSSIPGFSAPGSSSRGHEAANNIPFLLASACGSSSRGHEAACSEWVEMQVDRVSPKRGGLLTTSSSRRKRPLHRSERKPVVRKEASFQSKLIPWNHRSPSLPDAWTPSIFSPQSSG